MNDFLFFIFDDGTIKRINITPETLASIVALFESHLSKFVSEDVTQVLFDGQFKPDEDAVLYVDMDLSESFSKIPNNTMEYDVVSLPDDKPKILGLYHNGYYYFQCFSKHFVVKQRNIVLQLMTDDNYRQFLDEAAFYVEDKVHGVYYDGRFYFHSYSQAKQIFDLSSFYQDATDTDIQDVIEQDLFLGSDLEWLKQNSDSVMRKQITILKRSGILDTINVKSRDFKSWAKKADINKDIYSSGHIILPKDRKQCKTIFSFLNEDIFEGIFSKKMFVSNSKHSK